MGWWRVDTDTLAGSRFIVSPLAETTAALLSLARARTPHPGETAWLATHLPAYRQHLADDPITALLMQASLGNHWIASTLTTTPTGTPAPEFAAELTQIRAIPAGAARESLRITQGGRLPTALDRDDLAERTADLLQWVWTATVLPDWPRRRRIL
jgi:hypothetical protein